MITRHKLAAARALALRHPRLIAALIGIPLAVLVGAGVALATPSNSWAYLRTGPATGVRAQLALGAAAAQRPGTQNVYVSVGGSRFLDIVQVGARVHADGTRHAFAGWGRGVPNGPGSLYEERDLGPVDRSWHTYELVLINGSWRMSIDGAVVLRVPDRFRDWTIRSAKAAVEAEYQPWLGGALAMPARVKAARVYRGAWMLPAWAEGMAYAPPETRDSWGRDWLRVWR